jgi:hypothetical protein
MNEFYLRVDIPNFNVDIDIEKFFYWIAKCDRLKECMNTSEEMIVKLTTYKLKGGAFS